MTGEAALNLIMMRLGNRVNPTTRANVLTDMVYQQTVLENSPTLPWFLISSEQTLSVVAGTREVALPTGFLREVDEHKMYIVDTDGEYHEMVKKDYQELEEFHTITAEGELPLDYDLVGESFVLFPKPTVSTTIKGRFYIAQAAPTDGAVENNWLKYAPDLLTSVTGESFSALVLKDPELTVMFAGLRQRAEARLEKENTARMEAARSRIMG